MSKLIERKEDKFHNKLELVTQKTTLWSVSKLYDYGLSWQRNDVKANFRYWSTPEGDSILLDLDYGGPDWLFLRDGDIVIRINNTKNIVLKPSGENTDVSSNEGHKIICREVLYYEISSDDFKDLCDATAIEFQITGRTSFVNGKAENLQTIARVLYDSLFEPKYDTKALEEKLRGKWGALLSMILAFPASIVCGWMMGWTLFNFELYLKDSDGDGVVNGVFVDLDLAYIGLCITIVFFVINYFLPYKKKYKWIPYAITLILALLGLLLTD